VFAPAIFHRAINRSLLLLLLLLPPPLLPLPFLEHQDHRE
jgi:hypothetical protein